MITPSVPCTLLTPVAPHSLSFRPLVVPEHAVIEIHLPQSSRSHARCAPCVCTSQLGWAGIVLRSWGASGAAVVPPCICHRASFDGRHTCRLLRDSSVVCRTSRYALPMINMVRRAVLRLRSCGRAQQHGMQAILDCCSFSTRFFCCLTARSTRWTRTGSRASRRSSAGRGPHCARLAAAAAAGRTAAAAAVQVADAHLRAAPFVCDAKCWRLPRIITVARECIRATEEREKR